MDTVISEWIKQVNRRPDKVCLKFSDSTYTYQQVEDISNNIARDLKERKIGKNNRVALKLSRSENIVFFILGVFKVGAAYIFLDPNYPSERLSYMLEFARPDVLITDEESQGSKVLTEMVVVHSGSFSYQNPTTLINEVIPSDLAYLMFTSGSTGRPKAVMITHENIMAYLPSINAIKKVTDQDISLHTASFSFSSSVRQLFVPLLNGATLIIARKEDTSNLLNLLHLIKREKITVIDTVQSLWRYGLQHIESMQEAHKKELIENKPRLMVFSGDILPCVVVSRINDLFGNPAPKIVNLYGQTETIGGIAYIAPPGFKKQSGYMPIGKPLAHMKLFILDEKFQPVTNGTPGEIFVSGKSVSLGYYNNQDLTQKVFLQGSQIGEQVSEKVFKTGDLGKINQQGDVEILGRIDFQVKIRGVRIELGEVESVLTKHPEIMDALVMARERKREDKMLVGYFIPEEGSNIAIGDIRNYLSRHLPDAMVPERLMKMEEFPLTPNGKINRKALPNPLDNGESVSPSFEMTNTEKSLWLIFRNLLGIDNVSLTDSFFDLGGHSLLVVQLTERIEQILGKKLPASLIYRHPTVKKLAGELDQLGLALEYHPLVCLQPFGEKTPFFYVHGDDSNFILPRILGDSIPFYAFFHQGQDGSHLKYRTIESISSLYVDEILKSDHQHTIILGGYSIGGVIAFEIACRLEKLGQKVSKLILVDSLAPETTGNVLWGNYIYNKEFNRLEKSSSLQQEASYLKSKNFFQKIENRIQTVYRKRKAELYELTGKMIPLELRNTYIMNIYRKAREQYKAGTFSGDLILFRSMVDNYDVYDLGWSKFIKGKVDIHQVRSDHDTIIKLPAIRKVGEIIREICEDPTKE